MTHRGVDGKPVPSRFAGPGEFEALLDVVREVGRGVVAVAPGEQCGIDDLYRLQPGTGVPFTYGALLTFPSGAHKRLIELNHEGWDAGAQVWPQVTPRPLLFSFTLAEPFPFNVNPEFAALMAGSLDDRRRAYADPEWRRRARDVWADDAGRLLGAALGDLRGRREPRAPRGRRPAAGQGRGRAGCRRARRVARPRARRARPRAAGPLRPRQRRHARGRRRCSPTSTARSGCPTPAPTSASCVTRPSPPTSSATGCGSATSCRSRRPSASSPGPRPTCSGCPTAATCATGAWADVVVFDPETVAPGPIRRVRDFPADAERLTADHPTGVRHVVVNGTPMQVDGARVGDDTLKPGRIVRPAPRS